MGGDFGPRLPGAAALGWVLLILLLCLTPNPSAGEGEFLLCLICTDQGLADLFLNTALFLPLGYFLALTTRSWRIPLVAGLLLSLGVEVAQLWVPGRFTTLSDLIANGAGSGLGALVPRFLRDASGWHGGWPVRLATAAFATGILSAPGVFFAPSVPEGPLYGNWTPSVYGRDHYQGSVFAAEIGGVPLPSRRLADSDSDSVRSLLKAGAPLTLRFEATAPTASSVAIFRLLTETRVAAVHLTAEGPDLLLRDRMRADAARLDRPAMRLRGALAAHSPEDTILLQMERVQRAGVEVRIGDGSSETFAWGLGRGWALLWAFDRLSPPLQRVLDFGWIFFLFLPIGAVAPSRSTAGVLALVPLCTLVALPFVTPVLPTPVGHLLAGVLGVAGGALLRAVSATKWWGAATSPGPAFPPPSRIGPSKGTLV